jgi:ABC-2 type transport system ATP-binding protein
VTDHANRIVVSGLTKSFDDVAAVEALSFTVEPGSVTGFLGPNGAGKTTTLRILLGLAAADAGQATFGGRPYRSLATPADHVGAVLDAAGFHPGRSGRDHLRVYCTANGYPHARADEVLGLVGLTGAAHRKVRGYSLGMRQRLALATALLGDPDVLVLDEPANGLDPSGILWMRRLLRRLADDGRTVLLSSHVLTEMQQLVDDVVIIHRGRLVEQGSLAELMGGRTAVVVRTPHATRLGTALADQTEAHLETCGQGTLRIRGVDAARVGQIALAAHVELHELTSERSDLETLFFALTSGTGDGNALEVVR